MITRYVARKREGGRYTDPYLREDLQDFGIIIDTLECAVNWEQLEQVYQGVGGYCKSRPHTVCMTHISHCYPQGANLYFIFIGKMDKEGYLDYHIVFKALKKYFDPNNIMNPGGTLALDLPDSETRRKS